ncbi:MAG TPA: hypothetical protein VN397_05010 [Candidatus Methylomirabilis sp.]|nr:hypothetical protein [Candidatus Methylomirabilis sp.]
MPKLVKSIKEKLTPQIFHTVSQHHNWLTIIGVSFVFITFGYALAFVLLYNKILLLEAAISVLASK